MSQNTLHKNFAVCDETKAHKNNNAFKWPSRVCISEVRLRSKAAAVGEPQRNCWGKKSVNHCNPFIFCLGMGACFFFTFYRKQMKEAELAVKDSKTQLLLKVYRQISMWNIDFISAPTLPGICPTTEGSSSAKYSQYPMFLVSFVMQRDKGQKQNHQTVAIRDFLSSLGIAEKASVFLCLAPNTVICTFNTN